MSIVLVPELLDRFNVGLWTDSLISLMLPVEVLGLADTNDEEDDDLSNSDGISSFN